MQSSDIEQLLSIMAKLRDPKDGCPWDIKQNFDSIVPYTLEEAYEVADAIAKQNWLDVKEELGDLLFQVVFYSQMAKEQDLFDFDEVVAGICEKLTRRHPHVFADKQFASEAEVKANWEAEKPKSEQIKRSIIVYWLMCRWRCLLLLVPIKFKNDVPNLALIGIV